MSEDAIPQIGWYYAECCLLDTYRINNEQDLREVVERLEQEKAEPIGFHVFSTLEAVLAAFGGELAPEQEAREILRLRLDAVTFGVPGATQGPPRD